MSIRNIKVFILIAIISTSLHAAENNAKSPFAIFNTNPNYLNINDDWISANPKQNPPIFSLKSNKDIDFGNEVAIGWNLSNSIMINLSLFENRVNSNTSSNDNKTPYSYSKNFIKGYQKIATQYQTPTLEANRNISGYKFGISSKFGMGNNYILNIDFDYGQLADADLVGFNSPEVNTSSFALGFRKAKFGASLLSDSYLEENVDLINSTRLGFELDWHFSDHTTISFGSKQRINNNQKNVSNSLDSLTGDVQYIKFQHNL